MARKFTRKQKRATFIMLGLAILGSAVGLALFALRDNVVFFYSPTEIAERGLGVGQRIRLGGLVEQGSVTNAGPATIHFVVTDLKDQVKVTYTGILPDLFREGQGVVAEGAIGADGVFVADSVLAKHDEKYMPPEVAAALKKSGEWRPDGKGAEKGAAGGS